jgi:multimeric flavodoxin WrbA
LEKIVMKKILGIVGSQRKLGNSEVMVKQISREIDVPHQLQLLRLPEFNLKYCNGCYRCLIAERGCVLKDDLAAILDAIAAADALILAVPTYFLAGPSCLKVFVDRAISFYARGEQLWGKPAVGIGIAGIEGKEGSTLLDIERFFTTLLAENRAGRIVYGALPGETMLNQANRTVAKELADALFSVPQPAESGLSCSSCGGETFRFYADNRVRCMLCSEPGRLVITNEQARIEMDQTERRFMASAADALQHRDWLLGMVGRFKEKKEVLAEIRDEYSDETSWVKPEK